MLRCSVCGATRTKFDPFMYLSLPMPRVGAGEVLTLERCLREFMREERLDGDNLWRCFCW